MTRIVTTRYRPKRAARKKRKGPPIVSRIVTPAPLKPLKGPVIRLREQAPEQINDNGQEQPKRSAIITPQRKRTLFGDTLGLTPEEHRRRGDAADVLFREIVRRASGGEPE
jgi:hypothetical protein